ncbi:MAG: hypothetical protein IBX43_09390 [Campylobacterales bacterium]|nr:hypothetical protein [Campylobacterales bacterium]
MKFRINRQMSYILALALIFLLFVFIFAFGMLIPEGKEYRKARMEAKKISYQVDVVQAEYDRVYDTLKELRAKNRHIIGAYKTIFNPERFKTMYSPHFQSFSLSELSVRSKDGEFAVYEVNTSTLIHSPQGFYDFLDAVNKSDNIIGVNFPIHFERDANLIKSSFTMHVYIAGQKTAKEDEGEGSAQ